MNDVRDSFPVVTEGRLRGVFTGFVESDRLRPSLLSRRGRHPGSRKPGAATTGPRSAGWE